MYENGENIFYYLTLYNENYPMPAMPEQAGIEEAIVQGAYCWRTSETAGEQVHLLASGSIMQQAIEAAGQLEAMGYAPVIWSVTSFIELTREAEACERENRLHPLQPRRMPYIEGLFAQATGPVVAATDYLKSLPRGIAPWMPENYTVLGTDGFGLSESRPDLREHFEVNAAHIVQAALVGLYRDGVLPEQELQSHLAKLAIDPDKVAADQR